MAKKQELDARQIQANQEEKASKQASELHRGLEYLFAHTSTGGRPPCSTLTIKYKGDGYLATLKSDSAEGPVVCFVGASSPSVLVRKVAYKARKGTLGWRIDEWAAARLDNDESSW